ncbi:hypothetical protein RJ639_017490 [Escallonia herrerae]|uniref:Peptidase C1A papain C-terminal domain-containing protein n=1 Tax=Escallonia herrerae TaxID=1293975 RepID=A0AA88VCR2_9ASTE|nr:hypothetical protein RJ639_017490 [Escallonia herrerae]
MEQDINESFDWCNVFKAALPPVRDQGNSRICWAITAGDLVGSSLAIQRGEDNFIHLAWEELVEEVPKTRKTPPKPGFEGCSTINRGLLYIRDVGIGIKGHPNKKVKIQMIQSLKDASEDQILQAIRKQPLGGATQLCWEFKKFSGNGVFEGSNCEADFKHAFLIVGYGIENGIKYYKIQNSWGTAWGEGGYAKIRRDLVTNISFPVL